MILTFFYVLLAALGLGFLIFIHEYGHYWMARREGMKVEAFSIGFGKPLYVWERGGVRWQLCWLPFGGYVRIAGMEKKGSLEPYQIQDGFYGKGPLATIRVSLMGPVVNLLFAFLVFCLLFVMGGRQKPFSEYTHIIGSVEKDSALFDKGIRPGDQIEQINGRPFRHFQDFLYTAVLESKPPVILGEEMDYFHQESRPFQYDFVYPEKLSVAERVQALTSPLKPASYLIYNQAASFAADQDSPMQQSGIQDGDRIVWVDGELVFSRAQLVSTINEPKALLTVQRGDKTFLTRVPRIKIGDLRLQGHQRFELEDWQHEAGLKGKVTDLFFIPYTMNPQGQVQASLAYLNEKSVEQEHSLSERSPLEIPLQGGDRVIAVDGLAVNSGYEMLEHLQNRHLQVIVNRKQKQAPALWKEADARFVESIDWQALATMIQSIGTGESQAAVGQLHLLRPVQPRPFRDLPLSDHRRVKLEAQVEAQMKQIDAIKDPQQRAMALQWFSAEQNQLKLGIVMSDLTVTYNPSPIHLFGQVLQETWKTLVALCVGSVTPKYMSGPVGIVQVMQQSWGYGVKEALFWLGMISLNLAVLNLLPIPVLDGGHVCFALWETVTGKRIASKTMERMVLPFVILLIALLVYLTYNDLVRVFAGLLG